MRRLSFIAATVVSLVLMQSCEKDNNTAPVSTLTEKVVSNLAADTIVGTVNGQPVGVGKYTFFSFETNSIVPSADSATTKWDLGFRGTSIITNGGNSGPGQGGAFVFVGTVTDIKKLPADSTFKTDNAPASYAIPSGSNRGWYVYNAIANLITPIPGRVLVIRTAKGKFALVEIQNYYKGGVTPAVSASDDEKTRNQRYFTFRYLYQADGSGNFQ